MTKEEVFKLVKNLDHLPKNAQRAVENIKNLKNKTVDINNPQRAVENIKNLKNKTVDINNPNFISKRSSFENFLTPFFIKKLLMH